MTTSTPSWRRAPLPVRLALVFALCLAVAAGENVDLEAVHRIREEALHNSKIGELAVRLTDMHGPRLTNSPGFRKACEWAVKQMQEWGLENVRIETWPFGRGWSASRYSAHMIEPAPAALVIAPRPWSPGTDGLVRADAVYFPLAAGAKIDELIEKFQGKLQGKIVLAGEPIAVRPQTEAEWRRWTEQDLAAQLETPEPGRRGGFAVPGAARLDNPRSGSLWAERDRLNKFFIEGGVAAVLTPAAGQGGSVMIMPAGSRDKDRQPPPPTAALASEHYGRIVRLLRNGIPVKLEIDIQAQFHDDSLDGWNVLAEIPGRGKPDEIVMLGAHIDSWTGGTGALDNGAGVITAMEAMRILKASGLTMDRTVRIGLWGGEEQGLLGSQAHVKERYGSPRSGAATAAHPKFSVYFNLDYGSGKIRGIYLDGNDMARPIFEAWFKPFADMGAGAVATRALPYGGSDHSSFTNAGLPGFMFMQDPLNYFSRLHTNMDAWEHASPGDLMQNAAILASFAYHAATRAELMPRKSQ